jgi:hypothetical protein
MLASGSLSMTGRGRHSGSGSGSGSENRLDLLRPQVALAYAGRARRTAWAERFRPGSRRLSPPGCA